jgi:2-haloacid dehalogenase
VSAGIKAVTFDFYGTLVDVSALAQSCAEVAADGAALCAAWRAKQLEYTFWLSLLNRYRDFEQVTEAALDFTLKRFGLAAEAAQRERLMKA